VDGLAPADRPVQYLAVVIGRRLNNQELEEWTRRASKARLGTMISEYALAYQSLLLASVALLACRASSPVSSILFFASE
jgi:hypothetical protein